MTKDEVAAYLAATRDVEGWFFPIDAYLFAMLDELQRDLHGNLFEIGVHHGKTAIFLSRMTRASEVFGVCDVFGQQELNRDRSGEGNRAIFESHMRAHGRAAPNVFAKPSSELTPDDTTRACRFFHIDGGHRPEDVINDLEVADAALLPVGIVALDDLFNANWPGVSEGFYRFIARKPDAFAPLFIGGNKVLLARPGARYALDGAASFFDTRAFVFQKKEWLGAEVMTAVRRAWVDLDPEGAAQLHGSRQWAT